MWDAVGHVREMLFLLLVVGGVEVGCGGFGDVRACVRRQEREASSVM